MITRARRALRSPTTITLELAGVAASGLVATVVAQHPGAAERARLAASHPAAARAAGLLGLDHVFTTAWFLALVALAACSLAVVVWDGWRRALREWSAPREAAFRSAPFRRELLRASTGAARRVRIATHARLGTIGSPLFHTGLLVVTLAGAARLLLGADAAHDAVEGETMAGAAAFETQDAGALASPVGLSPPVHLVEVAPAFHPSGELRELSARVAVRDGPAPSVADLAVNAPLAVGAARLYLSQSFGPAAILDLGPGASRAALLAAGEGSDYEWAGPMPGGAELRLRAPGAPSRRPPDVLDVRVLSGGALVAAGRLQPGSTLALPDGGRVGLRAVRWWVRLVAARDPTAWPAYVGFGLAIAGIVLMFAFVRADVLVTAEPAAGGAERVVVALRPQRLAPLFAERFERLVEQESGRASPA